MFPDCIRDMGFFVCKLGPEIYIQQNRNIYEYIAIYVDSLAISARDPKSLIYSPRNKYKFKLKGTVPISFHLECDFILEINGVLCFAPNKYNIKMFQAYINMFGTKKTTQVRQISLITRLSSRA